MNNGDPLTRVPLHNNVSSSGGSGGSGSGTSSDDAADVVEQFTEAEINEISKLKDDPKIFKKLIHSIAPAVFGMF